MNSTFESDNENLRYGEYVLGLLDADARAGVAREIEANGEAAAAVALWQRHLMPLASDIRAVTPPAHVWARIQRTLLLGRPEPKREPKGWWDNAVVWRWLGMGATAVAFALAVIVVRPLTHRAVVSQPSGLMVSTIAVGNGAAGWTATMDLDRKQILVVPASPEPLASGRDTELWLIPAGGKPIAVGVFKHDQPTALKLSDALLSRLGPTATLAVSVEPTGGSPTGQPTGPVIGQGAIRGV
ncbi:anti-sigma factor [Pinirhizobacter sp.]|jgi:anti-sigma-K factor RskA|uniref:anti-sigma factor n=1 Tax=Pinirhizobacter sp. TaxID=2950432 RepID=UPI002F410A01